MDSNYFPIFEYNLTALLKLSDLDIRRVAAENKKLTVGEYYKMLSQFLSLAPDVSEAIKRFTDDGSYSMDWKHVKDVIPLFENMRCTKYIPDLNAIKDACVKGDHRLAASHAENIEQSFNYLFSQIMSAKIVREPGSSPGMKPMSPHEDSTLFSYIEELDEKGTSREFLVLVLDDTQDILEEVSAVLSGEYKVFKLPKPTMLENVLKQVSPDLFLLDYQMPEMNGFELIPVIRSFNEHKDTPIIFLTSEGTIDNITAAIDLGACDFIVKPFNPEQLREKVAKHIAR